MRHAIVMPCGPRPQCYSLPLDEIARRVTAGQLVQRHWPPLLYYQEVPQVYQRRDLVPVKLSRVRKGRNG